jgi:hypothetical protein
VVVATCVVTVFGSILVEWRSLKARAEEQAKETGNPKEAKEIKEPV